MTTNNKSLLDRLQDQIIGLELLAESSEAVAAHFRPKFEACWERNPDGSMGKMINPDLVLKLRFYTLDKEAEARSWRAEAADLKEAIRRLA